MIRTTLKGFVIYLSDPKLQIPHILREPLLDVTSLNKLKQKRIEWTNIWLKECSLWGLKGVTFNSRFTNPLH